ncbi:T9SS type A sorting domain-containing protein [Flavobacterium panacagri]|uniref:T9SS type A sorting domain-containing protein n=1 Tax=Flavobacterium panacagri TaxID=3034146 RepID=UPI0025A58F85|nr:T9SS type A sorting domain-containing protein [Flavobacterium panacagri]
MKKTLLCFLLLLPTLFFAQVSSIIHCAGDNVFDLTSRYDELTEGLTPDQNITIKYYIKDTYAANDEYAIADPKNFVFNERQLQIHVNVYTNGQKKYMNSFMIFLNSPLSISYANVTNPICGNQRLTVGALGGQSSYKYSLDGVNYQSENIFNNVNPGTYTVYVKDGYNCIATMEKIVQPIPPLTATSLNIDNSCFGSNDGRIEVNATGGRLPYSYSMNGTNHRVSNIFSNLPPGHYNLTVKDVTGCTFTFSVEILSPTVLNSYVTATNVSAFGNNDAEITVNATGGTPNYSYILRSTYGSIIKPYQSSNRFQGIGAGSYIVEVIDVKGCMYTTQITIPAPPSPLNATVAVTDINCNNPTGSLTVTTIGGSGSYLYSLNNEPYQASNFFYNLAPGNYVVNVKDSQNAIISFPVVIKSSEPLTATAAYTKIENCAINYNSTITITASGGKTPYKYAVNTTASYQDNNTFFGAAPGEHTINVKDANGCIFSSTLTIDSPVSLTATATINEAATCYGKDSVTITAAGGQPPYTYSFTEGTTYSDINTSELNPGYRTVFVKDANGCIVTQSVLISPKNSLNSTFVAYANATAPNSNDGLITINTTGGKMPYSYTITNGSNTITVPPQPSNTNTFNNLAPGSYRIVAKDAIGCVSQAIEVIISAPSLAPLTAVSTITQPTCTNPTGTISIIASGGSGYYQYSIDNGVTYSNNSIFSVVAAGTYKIVVRDAENAIYTFNLVVQPISPLYLNVSIVSPITCAQNGIIHALAIGGQSPITYSLNGGAFSDTNIYENLSPGIYIVTAKDNNGCTESIVMELAAPIPLVANITIENQTATINASSGNTELKYAISPNLDRLSSQNVYPNLAPGNYTAIIKDSNGCVVMLNFVIEVPAPSANGKTTVNVDFKQGQTLADLVIEGQNIKWYSTPGSSPTGKTNKVAAEVPLPLSTVLVDGVTYYASQTINGVESKERLAVTAKVNGSLSTPDFELADFRFYPNPVKNILSIKNQSSIDHIQVFSVSGKSVLSKNINGNSAEIDLSGLSTGMYILNVKSDGKEKAFKFVKE